MTNPSALHDWLLKTSERLLDAVGADRVTVRLDLPAAGFDVNDVAAEALAPKAKSIQGDRSIRQRELPTIRRLEKTLAPLSQEHPGVDPGIPAILRERYDVEAQLLGPLERQGELLGWLSVHSGVRRAWKRQDVEALARAAADVACHLGWDPPRYFDVGSGIAPNE